MQRHPALIPLSHDHQHGLAAALRLRRACEAATADLTDEVARFLLFARREMQPHFEEEEAAIAPLLVACTPELALHGARLAHEHAELRAAVGRLELTTNAAANTDAQRTAAAACAQLLTDHIRWEERELFTAMQDALADADLVRLGLPARNQTYAAGPWLDLRQVAATSGIASEQLNATPIDLVPGQERAPWVADRDVALVVVRGDATVTVAGDETVLAAPALVVVPGGATRALRGGSRGALVVSIHVARGGLAVAGTALPD